MKEGRGSLVVIETLSVRPYCVWIVWGRGHLRRIDRIGFMATRALS